MNTFTARRPARSRGAGASRRQRPRQTSKPRSFNHRTSRPSRGKRVQPTFDPSQFINRQPIEVTPEVYVPVHTFADWPLDQQLQKNLTFNKITTPSPIQDQIIPTIIDGRDVIGLAETGTGKTAAFLVPLIQKVLENPSERVLILTPTRELAIQIQDEFQRLSRGLKLRAVTCVGGVPVRPQVQALRQDNHFVIATPGRILDLTERGNFKPHTIGNVVLDEADRMLDMGFIGDMRAILSKTKTNRHTLFFSATMTKEVTAITKEFLHDPVTVSVKKSDVTASVAQDVIPYFADSKLDTLVMLLQKEEYSRVIIFGAMKRSVETLSKQLTARGIKAEGIHGNKTHGQRQRALDQFKQGRVRVLVATDVAARGIHVNAVTHVINYDLPNTFEDYVHRIGRTGRSDQKGQALTFVPNTSTS